MAIRYGCNYGTVSVCECKIHRWQTDFASRNFPSVAPCQTVCRFERSAQTSAQLCCESRRKKRRERRGGEGERVPLFTRKVVAPLDRESVMHYSTRSILRIFDT